MPLIIIFLILTITLIITGSKTKEERSLNIKRILFILLGIIVFVILIRITPIVFAAITSVILALIPFFNRILKLISLASMPIFRKPKFWKNSSPNSNGNSSLTKEEALDILGVDVYASEVDIKFSYKEKMKKYHPDLGGSSEYAKKLTEARDLLLELKKKEH